MTDKGRNDRIATALRSFVTGFIAIGRCRAPRNPGTALAASIRRDPPFLLGTATIVPDLNAEEIDDLLAGIAEAMEIVESDTSPWSDPGDLVMNGLDWGEMDFILSSGRRLHIGMPTILHGEWIAHDRSLMLRVAAACLVDLQGRSDQTDDIRKVVEWMTRAQSLAQRMAGRLPEDAGAHFAMPSQFGTIDLRSHAINGAPISAYGIPDDAFIRNAPPAYEMYGGNYGDRLVLEIKRARSLSSPCYAEDRDHAWIEGTMEGFVPRRKPEPAPTTHRTLLALDKQGRMILIRDPSTGLLTLPRYDRKGWNDGIEPERIDAVSAVIGAPIGSTRKASNIRRVSRRKGEGILDLDLVRGSCRAMLRPAHDDHVVLASPFSQAIVGMDPMIQALVMPEVRKAFANDEAEATGPDPYADRKVVVDSKIMATGRTNAEVVEILVRILRIRGRLDRVFWNAFRQSGGGTPPRASAGALGFIAVAGGAFEDLPDVLAEALGGIPEAPHGTSFEMRLADAYRAYSGIRIPRDWHPAAFSSGGPGSPSEHVRDVWRDLCDAIAEPLGLPPRYGVLVEKDAFG